MGRAHRATLAGAAAGALALAVAAPAAAQPAPGDLGPPDTPAPELGPTGAEGSEREEPAEPQDEPSYPSPEWTAREAANYARTQEAPTRQAADPGFLARLEAQTAANVASFAQRQADDPAWRTTGNLCETWGEQCAGDPFRYAGVDSFYDDAVTETVVFLDRGGARLQGRVWAPVETSDDPLPAVVITNGSIQAPQTLYWWAAQALVDAGYVVLTFDPRGQGRSDTRTPDGQMGSNANPDAFVTNVIDAVDFLRSTPDRPYPPNEGDDRPTTSFNPLHDRVDRGRLGLAGHSLGAIAISVVQGIEPWPGSEPDPDGGNPVDAIVAWDNLALDEGGPVGVDLVGLLGQPEDLGGFELVPRVPAMGQSSDYLVAPAPYTEPPDPDFKRQGYLTWKEAGVPTAQMVIEGGTHYEWSLLPTFPTTAWEAGGDGGWGRPLAEFYTLAWFDRWLKEPGEPGFGSADSRLLGEETEGPDGGPTWRRRLSFYYRSSRDFPDRDGEQQVCEDIRIGCDDGAGADDDTSDDGTTGDDAGADDQLDDGASGPDGEADGDAPTTDAGGDLAAPTGVDGTDADPALPATGGGAVVTGMAALLLALGARRRRERTAGARVDPGRS